MEKYLLIVSSIGAIGAVIAAFSAWKAANETRKTSLAHFILEDRRTYGSPEMLGAMMRLIEWQRQNPEDYAEKFGKLRKDNYLKIKEVDEARRRFSHYFGLPNVLLKLKLIDKKELEELRSKIQSDFYSKFIKPLQDEIKLATEK